MRAALASVTIFSTNDTMRYPRSEVKLFMGVAIDATCVYFERLRRSAIDKNAVIWGRLECPYLRLECILNWLSGEWTVRIWIESPNANSSISKIAIYLSSNIPVTFSPRLDGNCTVKSVWDFNLNRGSGMPNCASRAKLLDFCIRQTSCLCHLHIRVILRPYLQAEGVPYAPSQGDLLRSICRDGAELHLLLLCRNRLQS